MPCYEPSSDYMDGWEAGLTSHTDNNPKDVAEIREIKKAIKQYEAVLCSVFNQLDSRGIAEEVITQASREGLVDVMSFWVRHNQERIRGQV